MTHLATPGASGPAGSRPPQRPVRGYSLPERVATYSVAGMGAIGMLIAAVWPVQVIDSGEPTCLMRLTTGLPCPGCGMTRSWVHLAHGDVGTAFAYNAFGPLLFAAAAVVVGYVAWATLRRRPPERFFDLLRPRWVVLGVALWMGYSVLRVVSLTLGQDTFALVVA